MSQPAISGNALPKLAHLPEDIVAIAAFFALFNRMANVTGTGLNSEFYAMGRS